MGDMLKGRVAVITGAGNGIALGTIAISIPGLQARTVLH